MIGKSEGSSADLWIAIAVLGSLWGLSEVVVNDAIRSSGLLAIRAATLAGVGMLLMGVAVGLLRKPWVLAALPLVAILMKQMVVPILGVSVLCKANSCIAVGLQGLVLAGVVGLAGRRTGSSRWPRMAMGASAGFFSAIPFYVLGLRAAPCPYLLSFSRPEGLPAFLVAEGLPWALFAALLFPVGWWLGERLASPAAAVRSRHPSYYYGGFAALTTLCWVAAGLSIAAGG